MSENDIIVGFCTIIVLGVGAQWIGRRTGIPSLLLLLPAGLLAGDVLDLVEPEELFGDLLNPGVMLLVALLLFQSGHQLHLKELPKPARGSVARLVSVGLVMTFAGATGAVALALDVPSQLAFMAGAILVVSGPTVVGPLLDVVRPREPTGTVLLWEGTVLDPLGAILGVVVLNLVLASDRGGIHPLAQMLGRVGIGLTVGLIAALILVFVMARFLLTDNMEAAVALMFATAAFGIADLLMSEAGLLATVTLGIAVANQEVVPTHHIRGFGETLEVLILGVLFIVLGALVKVEDLVDYAGAIAVIVAALVLVVRPLVVCVALVRTKLPWRDRALIAWMDPRGIVAASTATAFAASLDAAGFEADFLLPVTFGVILGTGVVYGVTAKPVAGFLGVAKPSPTGVGLVGDDDWMIPFARQLADAGANTLLITSTPSDVSRPAAHDGALRATSLTQGLSHVETTVSEASLAKAVVSLDPDAPLTLLEASMIASLGRRNVLRVPNRDHSAALSAFRSSRAFGGELTRPAISERFAAGARVQTVTAPLPADTLLLASVSSDGLVDIAPAIATADPSDTLIGLCGPPAWVAQDSRMG